MQRTCRVKLVSKDPDAVQKLELRVPQDRQGLFPRGHKPARAVVEAKSLHRGAQVKVKSIACRQA